MSACLPACLLAGCRSTWAVQSPSVVTFSCNRQGPGPFSLEVFATAGKPGCDEEGRASTTVTILKKPKIDIEHIATPDVCEASTDTHVNVLFQVTSDTADPLQLPPSITANDGRVCNLLPKTGQREWHCRTMALFGAVTVGCVAYRECPIMVLHMYLAQTAQQVMHARACRHTTHTMRHQNL